MSAWTELEDDAGLKKVGTGTKTPVGGDEVILWLVRQTSYTIVQH